ncbi:hypothetical protein [Hymenobacter sp. CRA2]|uniref:hypothetical protein n=1 Tax=Hymenobacter sp. CRA2 TaxID=1955620 RepID=UPI00098FF4A7|nr:hypothetical protein [Hymenobacter sp. CRA2]OON65471.1 hypothetical protein B0919_24130 [Hymenobacter sp. CRA2]
MPQSKRQGEQPMLVPTNQLHIKLPTDWELLHQKYSIWRYRLTDSQDYYRRNHPRPDLFYGSFTNEYKDQIDRPFYFFSFDEVKPGVNRPALYTLLPAGHQAKPWMYTFGNPQNTQPEELTGEMVSPGDLKPHVLLKLMLALSFYEQSEPEKNRRVCQSKFYLRVKGAPNGKRLTAVKITPKVDSIDDDLHILTVQVEANTFIKIDPAKVSHPHLDSYFELFTSMGHTYLRQLRPSQIAGFSGDVYRYSSAPGKRTHADWHQNGSKKEPEKYKESRSYQVRHVQERFGDFLQKYGFEVALTVEPMKQLKPSRSTSLPLDFLPTVQLVDNRLNQTNVPVANYLNWLKAREFKSGKTVHNISFELVDADQVDPERPVLVITDAEKEAFAKDGQLGLLAHEGYTDPYPVLYEKLSQVVKQTLNVNPNSVDKYLVAADYLRYRLPDPAEALVPKDDEGNNLEETPEARQARTLANKTLKILNIKATVCLNELWLKWVIAGRTKAALTECLPLLTGLSEWGFLANDTLLHFDQGQLAFTDVTTPEGKGVLKQRFMPLSEVRQHFMARRPQYANNKRGDAEKADKDIRQTSFVLIGREAFELEKTDAIVMPNWPVIRAIKQHDATRSAKTRDALGVYAGGIWYNAVSKRYVVGGTQSSNAGEARGHHVYQIHPYGPAETSHVTTLLSLLSVRFVRQNQYTVLPYPFDLVRLHQEVSKLTI